jgi:hypothetical protein
MEHNTKREYFYQLQKTRNSKYKFSSYIRDLEKITELQTKLKLAMNSIGIKYGDLENFINTV